MREFRLIASAVLLGRLLVSSASAQPICTILVEAQSGETLTREGAQCEMRNSPASTFKIALALMGYDAGVLENERAPAWPYKEEYRAWRQSWKTTIDPAAWLRESVVWYSREITRRLGAERFQRYVDLFDYGNRDLSGNPGRGDGLANAWISASLTISPAEQVALLRGLLARELPVSRAAADRTLAILPQFPLPDGWVVHGKTGTGSQRGADGERDDRRQFGWFVGFAQKGERKVVFARLIKDDAAIEKPAGFRARDSLLADLPHLLAARGGKRAEN